MNTVKIGNGYTPQYIIKYENDNVKQIDVNTNTLKCHFMTNQLVGDYVRYVEVSKKQLNELGNLLSKNKDDWIELNKIHDLLFDVYMKHLDKYFDGDGVLKNVYNHYSTIGYRCVDIKRSLITIDYINNLLGVHASKL